MMKYLVSGASGLLGLNFGLQMHGRHDVVGVVNQHGLVNAPFAIETADLADAGEGTRLLEKTRPDVLLHCAALANIDACEAQPELAERVNAKVPGELAAACRRMGIKMVHISTDAVFDGQRGGYREEDETNPINVYARTKLAGEQQVAENNPDAIIARVNFYGWSLRGKRSLAEFFYYSLSAGKPMMGFTDVLFCPLQVNDLADVLTAMVERGLSGLYHVISPESTSKYEFGCRIARRFGLDESLIEPTSWEKAGLKANRSPSLTLSVEKLACDLGNALPGQQQGIDRFYETFEQGLPQRLRTLDAGA